MSKTILNVNGLCYSHKDAEKNLVFNNLSFDLKQNEIISILGKNGCGKTTLFNIIAGFLKPDAGKMTINNGKECSLVFQEYSLLDWKNVYDNISLALLKENNNEEIIKKKVNKTLELINIQDLKNRLPKQLSGGQKQRVSIARAFTSDSNILLLDEPFSALDHYTKEVLQEDLIKLLKKENKSAILVTHSVDEAIFFSDRILLMNKQGIYDTIKITLPKTRTSKIKLTNKFLELKKDVLKRMK
jgi:NitT/TauT family transport system ATP-binding protein